MVGDDLNLAPALIKEIPDPVYEAIDLLSDPARQFPSFLVTALVDLAVLRPSAPGRITPVLPAKILEAAVAE